MKKIFLILLSLLISLSVVGCSTEGDFPGVDNGGNNGGLPGGTPDEPEWAQEYSFDNYYHWYAQLNGTGKKGMQEHENMSGKCYYCDYYFPTESLGYGIRYKMVDDVPEFYYVVTEYKSDDSNADLHIEIPVMHKQDAPVFEYDSEYYVGMPDYAGIAPSQFEEYMAVVEEYADVISANEYPVLEIADSVFAGNVPGKQTLESIKLNEGLKKIGRSVFTNTFLTKAVIPNSVEGKLYNTFGGCVTLTEAVIGDGVTVIDGYCFSTCTALRYVTLGKNVREIQRRAFYSCKNIQYIVMPKSVVSIPEGQIESGAVKKWVTMNNLFQGGYAPAYGIFFEITKEEYEDLLIPLMPRDPETGSPIDPETGEIIPFSYTTYGYVEGWCYDAKLYFKGEWEYTSAGHPKPIN